MDYWNNFNLEDLPNEEWVDALGYDGEYIVSNLGRVKSLGRYVQGKPGFERWVKEAIKKQTINKKDGTLLVTLKSKSHRMQKLIYTSFYPEVDFEINECVMHINKNLKDNRLSNLEKTTRKESKGVDMIKSKKTIKALPKNLEKAAEWRDEYYSTRTEEHCKKCENKRHIQRRETFKPKFTTRTCTTCNVEKDISEFYKNKPRCRPCTNKYMKELRNRSK